MNTRNLLTIASSTLTLVAALMASLPAQAAPTLFKAGVPFTLDQLPPGQFRNALQNLPPQARQRAMTWLNGVTFPAQDVHNLRVDPEGGILYADTELPDAAEVTAEPQAAGTPAVDINTVFDLHSRPGASRIIYLDFTGHTISGTAWNSTEPEYNARPFDTDGNPANFGATEIAAMAEIWHRVAEDFAPYDVNVTTQDPASVGISFGPQVGRILITSNVDQSGRAMPHSSAGGVAYLNVWGRTNYASYYSPALVYHNNLANGTSYIAEAAAHEIGHNLGLGHDGTSTQGYYGGHGSDSSAVSWAPVMGVGYYKNVTQWSRGEYPDANNTQDDLAIIAGKLTYQADDHGDTPASASLLYSNLDGTIDATNPENDAYNDQPQNKGVIGREGTINDTDVFYFDAGTGALSLTVTPAWDAFYRTVRRGANLDVKATLLDPSGNAIASMDPTNNTDATLNAQISAGRYYLAVEGVGNNTTPYSDYGSLGQYFISGFIPPSGTVQNLPPNATFSATCSDMTCTFTDNSSDPDGSISQRQWQLGDGSSTSQAQFSHTYAAGGSYTVVLTVTDDQGAQASTTQTVSVIDPNAVAPDTPSGLSLTDKGDGSALISWNSEALAEQYEVQRQSKHPKNGKWTGTTIVATVAAPALSVSDASGSGTFRYNVRAINAHGASSWSNWVEITVTGSNSGGGGSDGGGGNGGKCNPRKQSCG